MKKYLLIVLLFCVPLFIYISIAIIFNPYNYFPSIGLIPKKIKDKSLRLDQEYMSLNVATEKIIEFNRNLNDNIIIGDSRAHWLNNDTIYKYSGSKYLNLGIPGISFYEVKTLIEIIMQAERPPCEIIWVGGIHSFFDGRGRNRNIIKQAEENINAPIEMMFRKHYIRCVFNTVYVYYDAVRNNKRFLLEDTKILINPVLSYKCGINELWSNTPNTNTNSLIESIYDTNKYSEVLQDTLITKFNKMYPRIRRNFERYRRPVKIISNLQEIDNLLRAKGVKLSYVVFPNSAIFHNLLANTLDREEYMYYIDIMDSLGVVYTADFPNSFTQESQNYIDLFHLHYNSYNLFSKYLFKCDTLFVKRIDSIN